MGKYFIDTHTHPVGGSAALTNLGDKVRKKVDVIQLNSKYPEIWKARLTEEPVDISDAHLQVMDRYGISHAFIQQTHGNGSNELVAATVKKHPDRYFGLLWAGRHRKKFAQPAPRRPIQLPSEDELAANRARAAQEVIEGVEKLGLIGVGELDVQRFTTEVHPLKIARDMEPFMDAVARYKIPVQIPTAWTQFPHGQIYLNPIWTDEIAYAYPEVPIILTKMGRRMYHFETALALAERNVNVYFDIVGSCAEHLRIAVDAIGADRIMFGTDWSPTWRWLAEPTDICGVQMKVLNDAKLSSVEREWVEWRTAAKIFKLNLP